MYAEHLHKNAELNLIEIIMINLELSNAHRQQWKKTCNMRSKYQVTSHHPIGNIDVYMDSGILPTICNCDSYISIETALVKCG